SVEAEFLIVIGTDELCRIERSPLECREHLIGRHLLRLDTKPGEDLPAHATNSELEPAQIIDTSDFFAEPAAHLGPRVPHHDRMDTEPVQHLVDDFSSASGLPPCVLMARIESERYPGAERQGRLPVGIEVGRCLGTLDSTVGDCIERTECRYDGTCGVRLDRKPAISRFGDDAREPLCRSENDTRATREG